MGEIIAELCGNGVKGKIPKNKYFKDCIRPDNLYEFCLGVLHFNIRVCHIFQNTPNELSLFIMKWQMSQLIFA